MTIKTGKLGIVRLEGEDLRALRHACFLRDEWKCVECGNPITWTPNSFCSGHMAHIKGRGRGGSDVIDNVRTLCPKCHMKEHNARGKPCPRKA